MSKQKKTISTETEWPITCNRFVAFIDIMGFKDMVTRTPHNEIYEMMKTIKESESINWNNNRPLFVKTTTYSDSIIIYSKDESYIALQSFIHTVAGLAFDLLMEGIPYKGSIAFGLMTFDNVNSIYFGQPLIDAYLLQEELLFYGIVLHATAEQKIINHYSLNYRFIDYLCPFKNGSAHHLTIYPITTVPRIPKKLEKYAKSSYDNVMEYFRFNTSGHLRKYIDNTKTYINYIKTQNKIAID